MVAHNTHIAHSYRAHETVRVHVRMAERSKAPDSSPLDDLLCKPGFVCILVLNRGRGFKSHF